MTASTLATRRWDTPRIAAVRFHPPILFVTFADGSEVGVAVERFDNPTIRAHAPDWARARATGHEVVVPTASGEVGIPWDSIRALTDAEFAEHWAEMASRVALDVGARVRGWREEQRLDPAALGQRAGVPVETVTGVEAGRQGVDLDVLDRLLAALGHDASDLIDEAAVGDG